MESKPEESKMTDAQTEAISIAKALANAEQTPGDEIFDILKKGWFEVSSIDKMIKDKKIESQEDVESEDDEDNYPTGEYQKFFPADKTRLKNALGSLTDCDFMTR